MRINKEIGEAKALARYAADQDAVPSGVDVEVWRLELILRVYMAFRDADAAERCRLARVFGFSIPEIEHLARVYARRVSRALRGSIDAKQRAWAEIKRTADYRDLGRSRFFPSRLQVEEQ